MYLLAEGVGELHARSRTNEMREREGTFRSGETMPNHFVALFRAKAEGGRWRIRHIRTLMFL